MAIGIIKYAIMAVFERGMLETTAQSLTLTHTHTHTLEVECLAIDAQ